MIGLGNIGWFIKLIFAAIGVGVLAERASEALLIPFTEAGSMAQRARSSLSDRWRQFSQF